MATVIGPEIMEASLKVLRAAENIEFIKTENLYLFDGEPGYALGQGQETPARAGAA